MNTQKKLNLIEVYRTYQSSTRHSGKCTEIQIMPDAVEKYYDKRKIHGSHK